MNPILVPTARLRELLGKIYDENAPLGHSTPFMMLLAAWAALEELGIMRVEELDIGAYNPGEDLLIPIAQLSNGPVLVRAKKETPKQEGYEVAVDFAADGPSETAWSVIIRDTTGQVVAVSTSHGSAEEAIESAKAWIEVNPAQ